MRTRVKTGIVSYGATVPIYRIKTSEIAKAWHANPDSVIKSLGILEKAVPAKDQDAVTLAVDATNLALAKLKYLPDIGAIYTGSESHPYAVKSSSAIIAEALGIGTNFTAADLEFACKAGTAAIQISVAMVASGMAKYALGIGSDTAQSKAGDALEYTAAAGAAAFLIGTNAQEFIAEIVATKTYTTNTPDFWRRETKKYPSHAGRFSGEPAYFKHITAAVAGILQETGLAITDFTHVVFHMPNARFPQTAAKQLGVTSTQLAKGLVVPNIGNTYSACSLMGLAAVLDEAKPNEKILLCSYGSGSGSDAFVLETTKNIRKLKKINPLQKLMKNKTYLDYSEYLIQTEQILQ